MSAEEYCMMYEETLREQRRIVQEANQKKHKKEELIKLFIKWVNETEMEVSL